MKKNIPSQKESFFRFRDSQKRVIRRGPDTLMAYLRSYEKRFHFDQVDASIITDYILRTPHYAVRSVLPNMSAFCEIKGSYNAKIFLSTICRMAFQLYEMQRSVDSTRVMTIDQRVRVMRKWIEKHYPDIEELDPKEAIYEYDRICLMMIDLGLDAITISDNLFPKKDGKESTLYKIAPNIYTYMYEWHNVEISTSDTLTILIRNMKRG